MTRVFNLRRHEENKFSQATHPSSGSVQSNKQGIKMTEDRNVALLIDGCRRQKEASQIALYKLYFSYGMGICLRYAPNRESALEMLNDGFLKAFTKIDQYKSSLPFKPWLRRIIVNAAIDHYRKYKQVRHELEETRKSPNSTYNKALDQLEFDDLNKLMKTLPPAYQMVFNLYVVENMTHAEIADELGISIGASKSNLSKARKKIKELLGTQMDIDLKPR